MFEVIMQLLVAYLFKYLDNEGLMDDNCLW